MISTFLLILRNLYYYTFGSTQTVLTIIQILIIRVIFPPNQKRHHRIYKEIIPKWSKKIIAYSGTQVKIEGIENLDFNEKYLILSNHRSNFDVYLLIGYFPLQIFFLSKPTYFKIPIIGTIMKEMGCIPIHRSHPRSFLDSITLSAQKFKQGNNSLIIYPEGTRSLNEQINPFKNGFTHIIKKTGHPVKVLPICISGKNIQPKKKWLIQPSIILISIIPPVTINPNQISSNDAKNKLVNQMEIIIKQSYRQEI